MNSLRLALKNSMESFGVMSPFTLTSDCHKNIPTTDGGKIITNKFKDAINSIEKEKVVTEAKIAKKCTYFMIDGSIDCYNKMTPIEKTDFLHVFSIWATIGFISQIVSSTPPNTPINYSNHFAMGAFSAAGLIVASLHLSDRFSSAIRNRINTINSDFNDLNELKIYETKLKEGQRDFDNLLVSNEGKLDSDVIGVIGQIIFENIKK